MSCTRALGTAALAAGLTLSASAQDVIVEGDAIQLGSPSLAAPSPSPSLGPAPARRALTMPVSSSFSGGFDGFGSHVDRDGNDLLLASETAAFPFEVGIGFGPDLVPLSPFTGTVNDVAIEGDFAVVMLQNGSTSVTLRYERVAGTWQFSDSLGLGPATGLAEIQDGIAYTVEENQTSGNVNVQALAFSGGFGLQILADRTLVAMDAGDGVDETGANAVVVVTEDTAGLREVHLFDVNGLTFTYRGVVAAADASFDYGADVAVDDGFIWIGAPSFDGNATDAGLIELWVDDGTNVTFGGSIASGQAGDMWGESISAQNGVAVLGEREADLVPGSNATGAARLLRLNDAGTTWTLTGEIIHAPDQQFGDDERFGAAVANDGRLLAVGEPAPGVANGKGWFFNMPVTSVINNFQSPALAGTNGEAFGGAFGMTFDAFPFLIEVGGALPNAPGQLVVGIGELNAPLKGGVLYPTPTFLLGIPTDGNGRIQLFTPWIDLGADFTLFFQYWFPDAGAPNGFAATGGFDVVQN